MPGSPSAFAGGVAYRDFRSLGLVCQPFGQQLRKDFPYRRLVRFAPAPNSLGRPGYVLVSICADGDDYAIDVGQRQVGKRTVMVSLLQTLLNRAIIRRGAVYPYAEID